MDALLPLYLSAAATAEVTEAPILHHREISGIDSSILPK
jgi:hypothetical protein